MTDHRISPAIGLTALNAAKPQDPFAVELTDIGVQSLVPGVVPIRPVDRLIARATAPLEAKKSQRACDLGLFDLNARNQLDLFAHPASAAVTPDHLTESDR